jgi:hypothetical protein
VEAWTVRPTAAVANGVQRLAIARLLTTHVLASALRVLQPLAAEVMRQNVVIAQPVLLTLWECNKMQQQ